MTTVNDHKRSVINAHNAKDVKLENASVRTESDI
jgi:hypothetical protein